MVYDWRRILPADEVVNLLLNLIGHGPRFMNVLIRHIG